MHLYSAFLKPFSIGNHYHILYILICGKTKIDLIPSKILILSTRHCFDVHATSITLKWRRTYVKTTFQMEFMAYFTHKGYAWLEHPYSLSQKALHEAGSPHATLSAYKTRLIIPGITIMNNGNNFKKPATIVPSRACTMFLAPNVLCTIT